MHNCGHVGGVSDKIRLNKKASRQCFSVGHSQLGLLSHKLVLAELTFYVIYVTCSDESCHNYPSRGCCCQKDAVIRALSCDIIEQ